MNLVSWITMECWFLKENPLYCLKFLKKLFFNPKGIDLEID